jgi:hypothetical protein
MNRDLLLQEITESSIATSRRLQAENTRLREALESLCGEEYKSNCEGSAPCWFIAREALAPQEKE